MIFSVADAPRDRMSGIWQAFGFKDLLLPAPQRLSEISRPDREIRASYRNQTKRFFKAAVSASLNPCSATEPHCIHC